MSTATEPSCFTPEDIQGAGNCAIGCVEYQVLTYPGPDQPPTYDESVHAFANDAQIRLAEILHEGTRAAVVEKTTTVTRRVILGPFDGAI